VAGGRRYKYNADIEFKVGVIWQPMPKGKPEELVKAPVPQSEKDLAVNPERDKISWRRAVRESGEIASKVVLTIVGIAALWYLRGSILTNQATSMTSFSHTVDPHNPRYMRYADRNPDMI